MAASTSVGRGVALVTGAGRGIGRACTEKFAAEGWTVGALDIQEDLVSALNSAGDQIIGVTADVTSKGSIANALAEISTRAAAPTVCVNAAAIYPVTTVDSATEEQFRSIFDVNVLGTMLVAQAFVAALPTGIQGSLVNLASATAYIPTPVQFVYGASKAAVVHLTRTLAAALGPRVRVNALAPGWTETEGTYSHNVVEQMTEEVKTLPIPRPGKPAEMANIVWWLAVDPAAAYITGETINANGGAVMA
jgi:NAD(P)-dependent dehydrogenase (short-subunit alcohol dehydrogenase family)